MIYFSWATQIILAIISFLWLIPYYIAFKVGNRKYMSKTLDLSCNNRYTLMYYSGFFISILWYIMPFLNQPRFKLNIFSLFDIKVILLENVLYNIILIALIGYFMSVWGTKVVNCNLQATKDRFLHPSKLITEGPYKKVRNPMIMGDLFCHLSFILLLGAIHTLCLYIIYICINLVIVYIENKYSLCIHFKKEYEEYAKKTPAYMNQELWLFAIFYLVSNIEDADADIAAGSYVARYENGKFIHNTHSGAVNVWNNYEAMKEFLIRESMDIYVWTKLYRKTFLDKYHIRFEVGRCDEDFLFNSQAFLYSSLTVMQDSPIYLYTIRDASTSRTFRDQQFLKYLEGTFYRVNEIEQMVVKHYSSLAYLAKRQKILYLFMILSVIVKHDRKKYANYYNEVITYLRKNKRQMLAERKYCGISFLGALLIIVMPSIIYFYFKRWKGYIC